ncbi:hypothetical protein PybrP1_003408 [[Pythium] brassicae (nom. inval.)]|nr:hypothetical protein PybrP1_003408 [[Pythium] brassicae (nom. inval.)]
MANEKSVEPLAAATAPTATATAATDNNRKFSSFAQEVDADAAAQAHSAALALKQQADQLVRAERFKDALPLYRDLLARLTRSHVEQAAERELVVSCHMNVLGAMSKLQQWALVPAEAMQALQVVVALDRERKARKPPAAVEAGPEDNNASDDSAIASALAAAEDKATIVRALTRVHVFRGYAQFRMGALAAAEADFRKALELSPGDTSFADEWKELQSAVQCEKRVKDLLNAARQHFQAGKPKVSLDCSLEALRECQVLQKDEYTGLVHGNLAAAYGKVGDDVRAIEHYKRALVFARKSPNQAAGQKERVYDLLGALAACYSRRSDFSSAHSVLLDAVKQLPECPARRDLEAHLFLNAGRVSFTLGKFAEAEIHLIRAEAAAARLGQAASALTALLWLSKACRELGKDAQAVKVLDKGIALGGAAAGPDGSDSAHPELLDQLVLAKLELLDPASNAKFKLVAYDREAALWQALAHFERKKLVHGHLRACGVLVRVLDDESESAGDGAPLDDVARNKLERVLFVVDRVDPAKLSARDDVAALLQLVLRKADFLVATGAARKAQALLVATLAKLPPRDAATQLLRGAVLQRLASVFDGDLADDDDELARCLTDALAFLRGGSGGTSDPAVLSSLLAKLAHARARQGDVVAAQELLEESVALARRVAKREGDNSELLCGALVGLCVLQMKQQHLARAREIVDEIERLPCAELWKEMYAVKDQLRAAKEAEAATAHAVEERKRRAEAARLSHHNSFAGWWERWWFVVSVALVGAAVLLLQVMELQLKRDQLLGLEQEPPQEQ